MVAVRLPIMELFEYGLELIGNGQANVRRVLQKGKAFVRQVEANDRAAQGAAGANDVNIHDVGDADEKQITTFLQMPLKPTSLDSFLSEMAHIMPVM